MVLKRVSMRTGKRRNGEASLKRPMFCRGIGEVRESDARCRKQGFRVAEPAARCLPLGGCLSSSRFELGDGPRRRLPTPTPARTAASNAACARCARAADWTLTTSA